MWELYDELLNAIPAELTVREVAAGPVWTMVRCEWGCGVAMTMKGGGIAPFRQGDLTEVPLRETAALVKSWNFREASIGHAALNAYYNSQRQVSEWNAKSEGRLLDGEKQTRDAFLQYQGLVKGKRVAAIGHFAGLEKRFGGLCELSILEREPQEGDYPDSACEYLLPEQDFVFMTGTTLTNKTLPRLLELSYNAQVILCGPSTVMATALHRYGVDDLAGFMVEDSNLCRRIVRQEDCAGIFTSGRMLRIPRPKKS